MKKNELADIKKLKTEEIYDRIRKVSKELETVRMEKNMQKPNLKELRNKKRDIAQMSTIVRQKELLEEMEKRNG